VAVIVGQGLSLGDVQVLEYAVLPWLAAHLFVVFYEEPTLRRSFGAEYETYRANVPRWIPRLSAWQGPERYSI
jgi:protein-S-isoprenylcysteine O-methyltransferase Ste14